MSDPSYLTNAESKYIENLYDEFRQDPASVDVSWQKFFEGFEYASGVNGSTTPSTDVLKELKVYSLIEGYRKRGHLLSTTNPIRPRKNRDPHLDLEAKGFSKDDLDKHFVAGENIGLHQATLREIIDKLENIYTGNIGIEYKHIRHQNEVEWIRQRFESQEEGYGFSLDKKKRILEKLNQSVVFEKFLGTKYVGQKRFSLEGGENTISALDAIINEFGERFGEEVVIGMAHRGRLNVLANILGKTYDYIFGEFEGNINVDVPMGDGDVKYHLGFSSEVATTGGKNMRLHLAPNPSHLEAVDPVVLGYTRAKQDAMHDGEVRKVLPILLHGDSAVAGQGVVYEIVQMSQLDGYNTGGSIHFIINNQVGFTTNFEDARSSTYSSALGNSVDSPILHVNGDDAEAVVFAVEFAVAYRQQFGKDCWVDMVCYRKHGHNESDEPRFTQPSFYALIAKHKDPRTIYSNLLVERGQLEAQIAKNMEKEFKAMLQDRLNEVKQASLPYTVQPLEKDWYHLVKNRKADFDLTADTSVTKEALDKVVAALTHVPDNIKPIKKVLKLIDERKERYENDKLDWAMGELLAYGTLITEGNNVRVSGQDVVRGTFSHRHACLFDQNTDAYHNSLNHIEETQSGRLRIFNSHLSEFGVLGFEYGYSMVSPHNMVIWEAQFGDFSNGAQVMIDQFITSAESKWQRYSGLTMLLPHGYEGEGPEHSNARPERYLQLAAENNIIVANCTTPGNYFHLLRRQIVCPFRKPLVVFTPKSLLRHPQVVSPKSDLTDGTFQPIILDKTIEKARKVLLCSGKVYYDLVKAREEKEIDDVAIVRLEQLYPLEEASLQEMMDQYPKASFAWVQEEPKNMGAWTYLLRFEMMHNFELISRKASASPATGFKKVHFKEQEDLLNKALA